MTQEQIQALTERIAQLEARNAELEAKKTHGLSISEKGCVSLSGLRRFPITFYPQEWAAIFAKRETIERYIEQNKAKLSYKQ